MVAGMAATETGNGRKRDREWPKGRQGMAATETGNGGNGDRSWQPRLKVVGVHFGGGCEKISSIHYINLDGNSTWSLPESLLGVPNTGSSVKRLSNKSIWSDPK